MNKFKYICCTLDLTIACRIIAFLGVTISVTLMTALINDIYSSDNNYSISRNTALAFGLDWKHFHVNGSITVEDDPEGKMVSIIVIFYSLMFLFTNLLLFFGSIKYEWMCALPWLICEMASCLSKFGALIYHFNCEPFHMSSLFIAGSFIYLVVMIWWWIVVFIAQKSWRNVEELNVQLEMGSLDSIRKERRQSLLDSPVPYNLSKIYDQI